MGIDPLVREPRSSRKSQARKGPNPCAFTSSNLDCNRRSQARSRSSSSFNERQHQIAAFRNGLNDAGYVEGRNVAFEFRSAEHYLDPLAPMIADLISNRRVAMIVASGSPAVALAAKAATATIPILFATGGDPVKLGLVASFNRPGGNVTGVNLFNADLVAKQIELLHELVPQAAAISVLSNPDNPNAETETRQAQAAARALGVEVHILSATKENEFDSAFVTLVQQRPSALLVSVDAFFSSQRAQLVALAARHSIPAMYNYSEFALAGGLMSYGNSITDAYRQNCTALQLSGGCDARAMALDSA